jgi:hypothetical protein
MVSVLPRLELPAEFLGQHPTMLANNQAVLQLHPDVGLAGMVPPKNNALTQERLHASFL